MENALPESIMTAEELSEREAQTEERFQKLVSDGVVFIDEDRPDETRYVVARYSTTKEGAIEIADRFNHAEMFDKIKAICFFNGMADALATARREIRKLDEPLKHDKALRVLDRMIATMADQKGRVYN